MMVTMRVSSFVPLSFFVVFQVVVVLNLPLLVHGRSPPVLVGGGPSILSFAFLPHKRTTTITRTSGLVGIYYRYHHHRPLLKLTTLYSTREDVSSSSSPSSSEGNNNNNFFLDFLQKRSPAEIVFLSGILLLLATTTPLTSTDSNDNTAPVAAAAGGGVSGEVATDDNGGFGGRIMNDGDSSALLKNLNLMDTTSAATGHRKLLIFPSLPAVDGDVSSPIMTETDVADVVIYSSKQAVQEAVQDLW